jgi:hypothetical protein
MMGGAERPFALNGGASFVARVDYRDLAWAAALRRNT